MATSEQGGRHAHMRLANGPTGQVLTVTVPSDITHENFAAVGREALGLIHRLTGCNCLSGRISVVMEDTFADVIRVNLDQPAGGH